MEVPAVLREVGVSGLVDILFMAVLIYSLLVWLKHTRRAALVLAGILIVAVIYLLARQFDLRLTVAVLQGFFAVFLIALVVIFQEELRYVFERIAHWSLQRKLPLMPAAPREPHQIEALVGTLSDLSRERIGALVVLCGRDTLARHLDGGETLDGRVSEAILKSLFDPHSIGHDGAVIVHGSKIERFGCHLPLSKNEKILRRLGTRHAAAVGLSELADALCLVVSEERGTISVARHGRIRKLENADELRDVVRRFVHEMAPPERPAWRRVFTANSREKIVALGLALALWFVLVHESRTVYATYVVPVHLGRPPDNLAVTRVEPDTLEVTFSAPRRSFYFVRPSNIRLAVPPWDLEPGQTRIVVSSSNLTFPHGLVLENVRPREVVIDVAETPATGSP